MDTSSNVVSQIHQSKDTEQLSKPTDDAIEAIIHHATSSRPSPDPRSLPAKDTRTQLFVGNLPYRVRWQDLKDLFRKAGTVLRADVSLGPDNRSRGYGTVLLATAEDAGRAVDMFNGYSWQTRILEVRLDRLIPEYDPAYHPTISSNTAQPSTNSIMTAMDLAHSHLSQISLHSPAMSNASAALYQDDSTYYPETSSSKCLFVGNLPFHCQWQDLKDLFRQAGTILRADVALGADGRSRGFGTVSFATEHDADRAMRMFNGHEYGGRQLKVHHDKYLQSGMLNQPPLSMSNPTSTIPSMKPTSLPPSYRYELMPSADGSPFDVRLQTFSPQGRSAQQSSIHHLSSPKQSHYQSQSPLRDHPHTSLLQPQPLPHHQHFSRIFGSGSSSGLAKPSTSSRKDVDMDNLAQALGATRFMSSPLSKSSSRNVQNYTESRFDSARQSSVISSSTSTSGISPAISNAPSNSTTSSSTSISSTPSMPIGSSESIATSAVPSSSASRAAERPHMQERKPQNMRSQQYGAPSYLQQQYQQQSRHPSQQSYQPRQHHHPGPIALPPMPHVTFPGSPHTPLGHGISLSPLYHPSMGSPYHLYPTAYHHAYQQPHYQHTPLGLPITPSMPPFTFLAPNPPVKEDGTKSPSAGTDESVHSRQTRNVQGSSQHAGSVDAQRANSNVGGGEVKASGGGVPIHTNPPHMHVHHAHARAHAAAAAAHAHAHAQSMPQPSPLHMRLNLANVPGAFSPGVAMSPGTFYGRPGEMAAVANPFINPAVGAPVHHVPMSAVGMNMNMMGVPIMAMHGRVNMNMNMNVNMSVSAGESTGGDASGGGNDHGQEQGGEQGQGGGGSAVMMGLHVPMGVPHGAYFYAMSSPTRTGTRTEPQGYFDPMYFPTALQQQQQQEHEDDSEHSQQRSDNQEDEGGRRTNRPVSGEDGPGDIDNDTHEPPTQDSEGVGNPWYAQYRDNDAAGIVVSSSLGSTISRTHSVGASRARGISSSLDDALGVAALGVISNSYNNNHKKGEGRTTSISPEIPKVLTSVMKRSGSESAHTSGTGNRMRLPIHARRGISKDGGSGGGGGGGMSTSGFQLTQVQLQAAALLRSTSGSESTSALTSSTPPPMQSRQ